VKIGFCVSGGGRTVEAMLEARNAGLLSLDGACALLDRYTPFTEIAEKFALPLTLIPRLLGEEREKYRARLGESVNSLPAEGLFLSFDWLLPPSVVSRFDLNMINLHMSLLPLFPGRGAIPAALASGMTYAGATVHRVDNGMDTGPIIGQAVTPISPGMTEIQLGRSLFKVAVPLCIQAVRWLEQGRLGAARDRRVTILGAAYGGGNFSPLLDKDVDEFSRDFLSSRYPETRRRTETL
jgi:phosphoribosylglycinamide formyltransferase-1